MGRGVLSVAALFLLVGCQSLESDAVEGATEDPTAPSAGDRVAAYFTNRGLDLLDLASVRIGVGPGLLGHARVTRWVAIGAGALGPETTWLGGLSMSPHFFGWSLREGGVWIERRAEIGISTFYYYESDVELIAGERRRRGIDSRGVWDIGAELYLGLIGVAAEVRPDELLDFVAGLIGNDPMLDDRPIDEFVEDASS